MTQQASIGGGVRDEIEMEPLNKEGENESPRSSSGVHGKLPPLKIQIKLQPVMIALVLLWVMCAGLFGDMYMEGSPVPAARKTLGVLMCVSTLWATEAVPLYVTSLLVPLLTVLTGSLLPASKGECTAGDQTCIAAKFTPFPPAAAAKEVCGQFFDPTVLLFMAGFR